MIVEASVSAGATPMQPIMEATGHGNTFSGATSASEGGHQGEGEPVSETERHPAPLRLVAADVDAKPWRNGLGMTRELASCTTPEGDLVWRISIGELPEPAAFSSYPGIDRLFIALGEMTLTIDGTPLSLAAGDRARFPGESVVSVALPWPTRALNVMTSRSWAEPEVVLCRTSGCAEKRSVDGADAIADDDVDFIVEIDDITAFIKFRRY